MDRETPTPRASGALQRAPIFEAISRALAEDLEDLAHRKAKILGELDIKGAREAGRLAVIARELERVFRTWQTGDIPPDGTERLASVMRLRSIEDEAKEKFPGVGKEITER